MNTWNFSNQFPCFYGIFSQAIITSSDKDLISAIWKLEKINKNVETSNFSQLLFCVCVINIKIVRAITCQSKVISFSWKVYELVLSWEICFDLLNDWIVFNSIKNSIQTLIINSNQEITIWWELDLFYRISVIREFFINTHTFDIKNTNSSWRESTGKVKLSRMSTNCYTLIFNWERKLINLLSFCYIPNSYTQIFAKTN